MQLRGAGNRDNPRFLREYPRERDLRRSGLLARRDAGNDIHQSLIRLPVLRRETRDGVSEISRIERRRVVDFSGEKPFSQWRERHEADPELLERWEEFRLRFAPPER